MCHKNKMKIQQIIKVTATKALQKYKTFNENNLKIITNLLKPTLNTTAELNPAIIAITDQSTINQINKLVTEYKGKHNFICYILHKIISNIYKEV